jgi:hypothetical protein
MSAKTWALALGLAISVSSPLARAADHKDGPAVSMDPTTDITDIYAWMQADNARVYMIMNVSPAATTASRFSDSALYVLHVSNRVNSADTSYGPEINIICQFDKSTPQQVECWAGRDEYVKGNATVQNGITSRTGKLRVFTGLRNDPFFFNLAGFNNVADRIKTLYPMAATTKDNAGCPNLGANAATLRTALTQNGATPPAAGTDSFARQNILSIVVSVDRALLTSNGARPLLSIWGSTNKKLN